MRQPRFFRGRALIVIPAVALFVGIAAALHLNAPSVAARESWNSTAAAHHMDERQTWWLSWPKAQRDHDTACVSCHTSIPYAMSRPSMRRTLGESGPSAPEQQMLKNIDLRVNQWDQVEPFYNDAKSGADKSTQSRGTEAVLNALVLARYDSELKTMQQVTRTAFAAMWATQLIEGPQAGAWNWLNFHYSPWEADESQYYGATMGAIAVGLAPSGYSKSPEIQPKLAALRTYLTHNYDAQPLLNKVVVLWASARVSGLLTQEQKAELLADIQAHQSADGGWAMASLGTWKRRDNTPIDTASDGYATGLTVYALKQVGMSSKSPKIQHAVEWLVKNQSPMDGRWPASSLNKNRDPESDIGKFMTDAATSYSALALEVAQK